MARSTRQKWLDREIARLEGVLRGRKKKLAGVDDEVARVRRRRAVLVERTEAKLAERRAQLKAAS